MGETSVRWIAAIGMVLGAALGVAGTFVASPGLRGLLWGIDGIGIVVGAAVYTVLHLNERRSVLAAAFLVLLAGETLVLASGSDPVAGRVLFGAGAGLWGAALLLAAAPTVFPPVLRGVHLIGAVLFVWTSLDILAGKPLHALTSPLPFLGYPFLAISLAGWAWWHLKRD